MADGRSAIVYFDARGRATSGVLADLSDDELSWIAQSRNWHGFPVPVQEELSEAVSLEQKKGEDYWYVKKDGKKVGSVSADSGGNFDGSKEAGGFKKGFKTKDAAAAWVGGESVGESVGFQLTAKSRTAMEKFIYARFPNDQKMKSGGRMKIMFSGNAATAAGVQTNTVLFLDAMECSAVAAVAQLLGYKGPIEKIEEASFADREKESAARNARMFPQTGLSFKLGTFMHQKTSTWEGWFYPLDDQKNGGWTGLSIGRELGEKLKGKPVKQSIGSSYKSMWKAEEPPSDVRAKLEAHPDFVGPKNEDTMVERTSDGPVRRARDFMDPTIQIFSVAMKDMTQEEFEQWLRSQGIRAKVTKIGKEFTAYTESKKEI